MGICFLSINSDSQSGSLCGWYTTSNRCTILNGGFTLFLFSSFRFGYQLLYVRNLYCTIVHMSLLLYGLRATTQRPKSQQQMPNGKYVIR